MGCGASRCVPRLRRSRVEAHLRYWSEVPLKSVEFYDRMDLARARHQARKELARQLAKRSDCRVVDGELHVEGDLDLRRIKGSQDLDALPDKLKVHGSLDLEGCSALLKLPKEISVAENLTLNGCTSLTYMPEALCVAGDLDAKRCVNLTTLPEELSVGGRLNLKGCTSLESLPLDLSVGEDLNIEDCSRISSLSNMIFSWPAPQNGAHRHRVYVGGSGLTEQSRALLRTIDAPTIQFFFELNADFFEEIDESKLHESSAPAPDLFKRVTEWIEASNSPADVEVPENLSSEDSNIVAEFLFKVAHTQTSAKEAKPVLANRVLDVIHLLADPEWSKEIVSLMSENSTADTEEPYWALNHMTLFKLIDEARGSRDLLRQLGKRIMRLDVVTKHAQRKIATLQIKDPSLVHLWFENALLNPLGLPVSAASFPPQLDFTVTYRELQAARLEAFSISDKDLDKWLQTWPEWERQQRLEFAQAIRWDNLGSDEGTNLSNQSRTKREIRKLQDSVVFEDQVASLPRFLQQWVQSGQDLKGVPRSADDLFLLKRISFSSRSSQHKSTHIGLSLEASENLPMITVSGFEV